MRGLLILIVAGLPLFALDEEKTTETRSFSGVNLVILDNVNGSIEASGQPGDVLKVEVRRTIQAESPERMAAAKNEVKLDMRQSSSTVKLFADGPFRCNCREGSSWRHEGYTVTYDFKLVAPAAARLDLYTVNHGEVTVRDLSGDFDIGNVNGGIALHNMGGSGKAHTVNGPVTVVFSKNPASASSFETVNGHVDLGFRPGLSADLTMKTMNGGMYTDYEVQSVPVVSPANVEKTNGRYVYRRGGATAVRIGSGGVEIAAKTLNGDIFIRKLDKK